MLRERHIPPVDDEYWNSFSTIRKKYNLTWNDAFKRLQMYANGLEYIFSAPPEMTKQLRLDLNTVMGLITTWISNIRDDWYEINKTPDISALLKHSGVPAITIGSGPSLKERRHLKTLYESDFYRSKKGLIFSTAHSLIWCLEEGVIPDYTAIVDASPVMAKFIDHDLVRQYAAQIKIVFCASTHPDVVKCWKGKQKYFFLSGIPQNLIPNVDTFLSILLPKLSQIDTGGNSGAFVYSLAAYLECSPIAMIGMDLGYPKGYPYEKTMYFNAYAQSVGREYKDVQDMISKCYTDVHHPVFNTDSYMDFVYEVFLNSLKEMAKTNKQQHGTQLINCTEGGCVFGEDIECMTLKEFLTKRTG